MKPSQDHARPLSAIFCRCEPLADILFVPPLSAVMTTDRCLFFPEYRHVSSAKVQASREHGLPLTRLSEPLYVRHSFVS